MLLAATISATVAPPWLLASADFKNMQGTECILQCHLLLSFQCVSLLFFSQTTEVNSWFVRVYGSWQKYGCSATAVTHTSINDSIAMMTYQNNGRVCPLLSYSVWQCTWFSEKPNITAGWPHEISHYTPTFRHTHTSRNTHANTCTQMRINGHKCTLNIKHILDQQYGYNYS